MIRIHRTLALVTLLSSAPLATSIALADPAGAAQPVGTAPTDNPSRVASDPAVSAAPHVEGSAPTTPMPLNLPDQATREEVQGTYGLGIATLVLGALLVAAVVYGAFYLITRRSWSTSH